MVCQQIHSHTNLQAIFNILWNYITPRGSFVDLVFRLVFFRESMFSDLIKLNVRERFLFADPVLYHFMIHLNTSEQLSYRFVVSPGEFQRLRQRNQQSFAAL